jgi:hypothetical protein
MNNKGLANEMSIRMSGIAALEEVCSISWMTRGISVNSLTVTIRAKATAKEKTKLKTTEPIKVKDHQKFL